MQDPTETLGRQASQALGVRVRVGVGVGDLLGLRQVERDQVQALGVQQLQLGGQRLLAEARYTAVRGHHHDQAPCAHHLPRLLHDGPGQVKHACTALERSCLTYPEP